MECKDCMYYHRDSQECVFYKKELQLSCLYYIHYSKEVPFKYPYFIYIPQYENLYVMNYKGMIYSLNLKKQHILKQIKPNWNEKNKTYQIGLYKQKKRKTYSVPLLLARTFIQNPENKLYIQFKDKNKKNYCIENLYWSNHYCSDHSEEFKRRGYYKKIVTSKTDTISSNQFSQIIT